AVLNHMRERLSDYQEQYGDLYNLEATPAESTSYRLAKHDKKFYPDIITASDKTQGNTPYYTNSSHLPVGFTDDIFEALDMQDELHTLYTSGTVFHAFLGEKLPDWKSAATLVRTIAEHYRLPYYSISPTYSVCKNHGYLVGEQFVCPECGEKTEVYSRITGYYRPVQNWNDGKAEEYKARRVYSHSKLTGKQPLTDAERAEKFSAAPTAEVKAPERVILFTTATCPNCKAAKMMLDKAGVEYEVVLANDRPELVAQFEIKQAPTLVVVAGDMYNKYVSVGEVKRYIESKK
ncbi:MAG: ribonucleoside triphosphate reductase, partial [Clostridia bacterium]|nr:ribonucleoside triphosphate reductase [Clostridia bacterium]